jgi:DNA repair photolyase
MDVYTTQLMNGISRSKEFERKHLASFAINVGTKCGHACAYCSSGAVLRCHRSFRAVGRSPFESGYAIVDPTTPDRVARDARRLRKRGLIQLCTTVDAWAPEAREHGIGRKCLEAVLREPGWSIRILTKSAAVADDFDLLSRYRDRVLLGLSVTGRPDDAAVCRAIEPNASTVPERLATLRKAAQLGIRTYGMLCPLIPGVAGHRVIDDLVRALSEIGIEELFAEPINARGPGLHRTEHALRVAGHAELADSVSEIRNRRGWSQYVVQLLRSVQDSARRWAPACPLHFLLYPKALTATDRTTIQADDEGVIYLD